MILGFVAVLAAITAVVHLYLWKRMVRDTLRRGWPRRTGTITVILLAVLVPVTLIGVRGGYLPWLALPGYLWIAGMFYLFVVLAVLEIPRLAAAFWLRHRAKRAASGTAAASETVAAS